MIVDVGGSITDALEPVELSRDCWALLKVKRLLNGIGAHRLAINQGSVCIEIEAGLVYFTEI